MTKLVSDEFAVSEKRSLTVYKSEVSEAHLVQEHACLYSSLDKINSKFANSLLECFTEDSVIRGVIVRASLTDSIINKSSRGADDSDCQCCNAHFSAFIHL